MNAPANIKKRERLRELLGDDCWLCGKPIDFNAKPNSGNAWSVEHLLATSHGGSKKIENLVLCHVTCNRQLGSLSVADKVARRDKRLRKEWRAEVLARITKTLGAR